MKEYDKLNENDKRQVRHLINHFKKSQEQTYVAELEDKVKLLERQVELLTEHNFQQARLIDDLKLWGQ